MPDHLTAFLIAAAAACVAFLAYKEVKFLRAWRRSPERERDVRRQAWLKGEELDPRC